MIRSAYVAGVRRIGALAERTSAYRRLRANGSRSATWLASLPAIYDLDAMLGLDLPWWTFDAIDAVDAHLRSLDGRARVFEFGSGASTVWLAARAAEVHSVEHDEAFAAVLEDHLDPDVVTLHLVAPEPSERPAVPSRRRGHGHLDFARYVDTIDRVGGAFDLVVVDGRARVASLERALEHLSPVGIALFDDAWRPRYRSGLRRPGVATDRRRGLTPGLPYPSSTALLEPRQAR